MKKKLTLTIDKEVYNGFRQGIGSRKISHFVEDLVRPHVGKHDLHEEYRALAANRIRESKALEWAEATSIKLVET
jgi:hypothetical protein